VSKDQIWQDYMRKNFDKFISSLKNDDFLSREKETINPQDVDFSKPKSTYEYLRKIITQEAIKRLQNRFRAHKYRENRGIRNLQLKSHSLEMLDKFKAQVGADTLEEAIDFLLSPDYSDYGHDVDQAKQQLGNEKFNSTELMLNSFTKRLKKYDRERLSLIIELAFYEGWKAAKQTKKRTGNPQKEALEKFELYKNVVELI
jgi:pyruvate-formate lyase